jgi:hypothetical protein
MLDFKMLVNLKLEKQDVQVQNYQEFENFLYDLEF